MPRRIKIAVVGHVEWADVLYVETLPRAGDLMEASSELSQPAGAGPTAARQLARLGADTTFFTTLTDDPLSGRAREWLTANDITVEATVRTGQSQRRAMVVVDAQAERTILTTGPKLCPRACDDLPWAELDSYDGVCFVCGDPGAVAEARRARVVVATARWLPALRDAGVKLDAIVQSVSDPAEHYSPGDIDPPPRVVVTTAGRAGGSFSVAGGPEQTFAAAAPSPPPVDSYGAGDTFLAGLTFGLARGDEPARAIELAAHCGAAVVGRRGLDGQLDAGDVNARVD